MRKLLGVGPGLMRGAARLLLLTLSVTTLGPVLHDVHDAEMQPPAIHDESQHALQAAPPLTGGPLESEHCVACHFVRTSRGAVSWEVTGLHDLSAGHVLLHSDGAVRALLSASPTPARAPPAFC
jgi:hypothetical protein